MSESKNTKWVRLGDYIEVFDKRNTDGKPLLFYGINKDKTFMPTVADTNELDNSKYKAEFSAKAKMIPFDQVESRIGHAVGGVCPFGINEGVEVYLDVSLKRFSHIYPACGSSNSAIKMTLSELELTSNYQKWIDVCKIIE